MPLDVTYSSPKRERGKVRGNKRQPRTSGPHSECVSYYLDEQGNKRNGRIFKRTTQRTPKTRRDGQYEAARRQSKYALLASVGNNSDVD